MTEKAENPILETALRMLAASPKSAAELAVRLKQRGYAESAVQAAIGALEKGNVLDDRRFARDLFERYHQRQPSGRRRIAFEMKKRRLPESAWGELLEGLSEDDEAASARQLAEKLWRRHEKLPEDRRRKKVYDALMRRGFDYGLAGRVIRETENHDENE